MPIEPKHSIEWKAPLGKSYEEIIEITRPTLIPSSDIFKDEAPNADAKYCGPEGLYPWEAEQMSIAPNTPQVCKEDKEIAQVIKYNECISSFEGSRFNEGFSEGLCKSLYLDRPVDAKRFNHVLKVMKKSSKEKKSLLAEIEKELVPHLKSRQSYTMEFIQLRKRPVDFHVVLGLIEFLRVFGRDLKTL